MKQEFLKAKADTIRITVFQDNRPVVPTAATITLFKNGSSTELQAAVAVTAIDSTTGEMTYSLTATHTATIGIAYKAEWKYTVGGVDFFEQQLFDVVLSKLSIPITDDDIFNELDSLRDALQSARGTNKRLAPEANAQLREAQRKLHTFRTLAAKTREEATVNNDVESLKRLNDKLSAPSNPFGGEQGILPLGF